MDKRNQEMNIMESVVNKFNTTSSMNNMNGMDNMSGMKMENESTTNTDSSIIALTSSVSYPGQKDGQLVSKGTHVHCNRFNGKNSDHRYWSHSHPQAYIDYVGSDCYIGGGGYNCTSLTSSDTACDGLNTQGKGVHDCSSVFGYPLTAWYRN